MSELYRLVYASKNLMAGSEAEKSAAVMQILATSQCNNAAVEVTGALMFNGGAFAQVLEGPRQGVETTFERIQRDERHGDVTVLQFGPVEERGFAGWSMAFVGQSAAGQAQWSGLAKESGFDLGRLDGDAVFAMLHALILEEEGVTDAASALVLAPPIQARTESLDVAQLRAEIAEVRPDRGEVSATREPVPVQPRAEASAPPAIQPAREGRRPSRNAAEASLAIFKAALASERRWTTELRAEIDALRADLAASEYQQDAVRKERDLWAARARALAVLLCREVDDLPWTSSSASEAVHAERMTSATAAAVRDAA